VSKKDTMIKVGLTGTRFSGKDNAVSYFKKIGIPIFDADTVIKFILNYNWEIVEDIKIKIGNDIFDSNGRLDYNKLVSLGKFSDVISLLEDDLFFAYDRFTEKNSKLVYSIFNCSILFEENWNKKMDYTISVYAPFVERVERAKKYLNSKNITKITSVFSKETSELDKNKLSDYVIHSYGQNNVLSQVRKIDQELINNYLFNRTYNAEVDVF
jgi:dephospho-CoA kinase